MYLAIANDGITLHEPRVTSDVYASYRDRLAPDRLAAVVSEHADGELLPDGAHLLVPVATLRRLAAGHVDEGWDAELGALLEKLRERGRLSEDGDAVRAPLERER